MSATDKQEKSFDRLVEAGVYSDDFEHAPAAKKFVSTVLSSILPAFDPRRPLILLDCGCGTGAWLAYLAARLGEGGFGDVRYCGFDLSGKMIEVARRKLADLAAPQDLKAGSLLDDVSYDFAGLTTGADLIFTYDVVQQLPRRQQYQACETITRHLAPGGVALIFDNDSQSRFGRRMARRKFFTRYFGLKLVPRYYCNAAYPPLERFRDRFAANRWNASIQVRSDRIKRALVVRKLPGSESGS